ncbi:MAG: TIGR02710 family CRISPR-associated protein [Gammaproteobacteria bacterium]|nr:TIGR02710 family CRISPR-associated protein [Gammaproteobacteria bacterium]
MTQRILISTVGGSHQPIVTAIQALAPDFVCFICSEDDAGTGQKGSWTQITQAGLMIKASFKDEKPTLPNIPTQVGLSAEQFEVVKVNADDLSQATQAMQAHLRQLIVRFNGAEFIADYTGGTKTMSAALVVAALDLPQVELHVVTGNRSNLVKVEDGMQFGTNVTVDSLRFQQQLRNSVAAWQNYGYELSAEALAALRSPTDSHWRGVHGRMRDISGALAAWDRFEHTEALNALQRYQGVIGKQMSLHFTFLKMLTSEDQRRSAAQWLDLWLNASRRGEQQRYDDAVARCYRLWEWAAQWLLQQRHQLNTADLPHDLPLSFELPVNREGKRQASLLQSWKMVAELDNDAVADFMRQQQDTLRDLSQIRNYSMLAHGFTPVNSNDWKKMASWTGEQLLTVLYPEFQRTGMKLTVAQLQLPRSAEPFLE